MEQRETVSVAPSESEQNRTDTDTPIVPKGDVSQTLFGEEFKPAKSDPKWFAEFWAAYPRKVAKDVAQKKYKAVKTLAQHEAIMAALRQQLPGMLARETDFRPHPSTWLNQKRWTDEDVQPAPSSNAPQEIPTVTPEMLRRMFGK